MVHNYSLNECSIFIFDIDWYCVNACIQQSLLLLQTLLHLLFSNNSHNALLVYIYVLQRMVQGWNHGNQLLCMV